MDDKRETVESDGTGGDHFAVWAKLGSAEGAERSVHPLLCHLIDVAAVAQVLWDDGVGRATRARLGAVLQVEEAAARAWVAFFAGLHDLGKASPSFQYRAEDPVVRDRLRVAGLTPPRTSFTRPTPHGTITAWAAPRLLEELGVPGAIAARIATAIGGHHGVFPRSGQVLDAEPDAGRGGWEELRRGLTRTLVDLIAVPAERPPLGFDNATAIWLAGFVSVADWLGSDEANFPYAGADLATLTAERYAATAATRAANAVSRRGWRLPPERAEARSFAVLFPKITPNPMQAAVAEIGAKLASPGLVVIEAPMGEGKTEAALALVERWGAAAGRPACYVALPTQATSDQMFGRVRDFLANAYQGEAINLQLLHGHAALSAEFAALRRDVDWLFVPADVDGERGYDQAPAGVVAAEWFTHRKRGLLAPFGVGTIDQALLGALQTRHGFVRLFGLADKTIVLDEVHAYDAYMSALLERLLAWLGALGSSVVLLSATLPAARRRRLLGAYAGGIGQPAPDLPATPYPRLSWVSAAETGARHVPASCLGTKRVRLEWIDGRLPAQDGGMFPLGERLREALADGGCAAVICNTVARAQQVYQALRPYFLDTASDGEPELDLLHARFLYADRQERERRALRRFGKEREGAESPRPHRAVLVATQVIEQSLDLDFDLMVSDPAPVDLVLQRLGRLHRHRRADRPVPVREPTLLLCLPERVEDGVPSFDRGTAAVYDGHVLLRSWLALHDRGRISVPMDIGGWIEQVYDDDDESLLQGVGEALRVAWSSTKQTLLEKRGADEEEAAARWIKQPSYGGHLWRLMAEPREEDAPEFHPAHQALTRLTERTVSLICLEAAEAGAMSSKATPTLDQAQRLLRRSVTVGDKRVVDDLLRQPGPTGWAKSALLRHHRLMVLTDGSSDAIGRWRLQLDENLGLRVIEAGKEEGR